MTNFAKNVANAVGDKTARACDSCITKRARWYCASDDAFFCQNCDSSVHSANPLARRPERVLLKQHINYSCSPSWHKGFTKKARTPRHGNKAKNPFHLVPEVCYSDETNSNEEREEQLLYRVPMLDPFVAELESLLGNGLENQCMGMEELGLIDNKEVNSMVKVDQIEMGREPFELCFDYGDDDYESLVTCEEVEEKVALDLMNKDLKNDGEVKGNNEAKMNTLLQLDYEAVITAWESQKSPWVTGDKLDLEPHQCWPHCMGTCGMKLHHQPYGEFGGLFQGHPGMADEGREARVSRYREKRRTRLFSKKIRYEVRKLNAEKRPRMKGRFVKRASFTVPPTFPLLNK